MTYTLRTIILRSTLIYPLIAITANENECKREQTNINKYILSLSATQNKGKLHLSQEMSYLMGFLQLCTNDMVVTKL